MHDGYLKRARRLRTARRLLISSAVALGGLSFLLIGFSALHDLDLVSAVRYRLVGERKLSPVSAPFSTFYTPDRVEWLGNIDYLGLSEASGLALSTRDPNVLWAHNDSGNRGILYALYRDGRLLETYTLELAEREEREGADVPKEAGVPENAPRDGESLFQQILRGTILSDWEDMSSFELDGEHYLLIGDVGDNLHWRRQLRLLVVREPEIPAERLALTAGAREELAIDATAPSDSAPLTPSWVIRFGYPNGPRDCEAVAVDPESQSALLLTKRNVPPELYRVPLLPGDDPDQIRVAERVAALDTLPQPGPRDFLLDPDYAESRAQPTGLDVTARLAAVVTYGDAYIYPRAPGQTWSQVFASVPKRIALPLEPQREAGALSSASDALYITTERDQRGAAALFRVVLGNIQPPAMGVGGLDEDEDTAPGSGEGGTRLAWSSLPRELERSLPSLLGSDARVAAERESDALTPADERTETTPTVGAAAMSEPPSAQSPTATRPLGEASQEETSVPLPPRKPRLATQRGLSAAEALGSSAGPPVPRPKPSRR